MNNGKEKGWDIPSAPFRDGREICHPPTPRKYFHQGEKGFVCIYLEEASFPFWRRREFVKAQRLPLQNLGAASLGAVVWWLGPMGQG